MITQIEENQPHHNQILITKGRRILPKEWFWAQKPQLGCPATHGFVVAFCWVFSLSPSLSVPLPALSLSLVLSLSVFVSENMLGRKWGKEWDRERERGAAGGKKRRKQRVKKSGRERRQRWERDENKKKNVLRIKENIILMKIIF